MGDRPSRELEFLNILNKMKIEELKMEEGLTYVLVNGGSSDIEYHYVSYQGKVIGIGAYSNSSEYFIAAQLRSHSQEILLTQRDLPENHVNALVGLEHLFSVYFRDSGK